MYVKRENTVIGIYGHGNNYVNDVDVHVTH